MASLESSRIWVVRIAAPYQLAKRQDGSVISANGLLTLVELTLVEPAAADLFVKTEALSWLSAREPKQIWKGCRALNSDIKVRSLAPSSVGPQSQT